MRIGILGGTFDPIHFGHLHLADKVCQRLRLKKIIFIPTYLTPHKGGIKITPAAHRYRMAAFAVKKNKKFELSDIEVRRKGRSYSVETLKSLRKKYGTSAEIFFITGSDSLEYIDKWKDVKAITRLCRFVVVKRPGFRLKNVPPDFLVLRIGAKDISASTIRDRIKNGRGIEGMVPRQVKAYIDKYGLYT